MVTTNKLSVNFSVRTGLLHWLCSWLTASSLFRFWEATKFCRCRINANHSALAVIKSVLLMIQLNPKKLKKGYGTLIKSCQRRVKHWHNLVGVMANIACGWFLWFLGLMVLLFSFRFIPVQLQAACTCAHSSNHTDVKHNTPFFNTVLRRWSPHNWRVNGAIGWCVALVWLGVHLFLISLLFHLFPQHYFLNILNCGLDQPV